MRDKQQQTTEQTVKIELLSQWKLEAEFRNICCPLFQRRSLLLCKLTVEQWQHASDYSDTPTAESQ